MDSISEREVEGNIDAICASVDRKTGFQRRFRERKLQEKSSMQPDTAGTQTPPSWKSRKNVTCG